MARVLIVEDERELAAVTKRYLEKEGYDVSLISDGGEAMQFLLTNNVELLILDVMLPAMDGFSICETVRKRKNVPIIIVSAKTDEESRVLGLNLGADDYLVKPYSVKELVARVNAQMRRSMGGYISELSDGELRLNVASKEVLLDKMPLTLTAKEFDLLKLFLENRGRVLNKDFLLNTVWGVDNESEPSTLTVHIGKLREKIGSGRIATVWGVGYRYEGC